MHSDRYMKAVLTVIAACLVWICVRDVTLVKPAHAVGPTDVNIVAIDGNSFSLGEIQLGNAALPVKVKN